MRHAGSIRASAAGVAVLWSVAIGSGSITPDTALTDAQGHASATHTLGAGAGTQVAWAAVPAADPGSPALVILDVTTLVP